MKPDKLTGDWFNEKPAEVEHSAFLPLFRRIDELRQAGQRIIVAIDGNSAAGKSSLAAMLQSAYSCNVFPMDDFFLRPEQRTKSRLDSPGGNIDYERFTKEVLGPLKSGTPFCYQPYDCQTLQLAEPVTVSPGQISVVEGVYSMHPLFAGAYDVKVFLRLGEAEQRLRLSRRNSALYNRFIDEWIPMENKYFDYFKIYENCHFVFDVTMHD